MRKLLSSIILSSIVLLPATAFAKPMSKTGYPVVSRKQAQDFICYAHTEDRKGLDLRGLCGVINSTSTSKSGVGGVNSLGSGIPGISNIGDGTSTGKCDFPDQLDSAGRRCGGRAASERPGGK